MKHNQSPAGTGTTLHNTTKGVVEKNQRNLTTSELVVCLLDYNEQYGMLAQVKSRIGVYVSADYLLSLFYILLHLTLTIITTLLLS